MSHSGENVLERKVIHPGKPFIKEGGEHARAYIVQGGLIQAYVMEGEQKIEVAQYGPGRIIAEICLMSDEPMTMNYEALQDSTVVTMTRSEFQQKISKMDKNIWTILEHVMNKLNLQYTNDIDKAKERSEVDEQAMALVRNLIQDVPEERKIKYKDAILPHINAVMKKLKELKEDYK